MAARTSPNPAPAARQRPTGPLEAVMLACRDAVTGYEAADEAHAALARDEHVARIEWTRTAAGLFPPLDAQQAAFAVSIACAQVERLWDNIPEDVARRHRGFDDLARSATAILENVVLWLGAAHGADVTAPEVRYHLRPGGDGARRRG